MTVTQRVFVNQESTLRHCKEKDRRGGWLVGYEIIHFSCFASLNKKTRWAKIDA